MAQQNINIGSNANDGTGDDLRTAMGKINTNFTELYAPTSLVVDNDTITIARRWNDDSTRTSSVGKSGDTVGMIAWEDDHVYICTRNYDGSTVIWKRSALSTF
jgi:hypothetical protein